MNVLFTVYGIAIILIGFVCIYNLVHYVRYYSQFKAFNDNIATWAKELDISMRDALIVQSRQLLTEMDERISASRVENIEDEENNDNNNDNNLEEND